MLHEFCSNIISEAPNTGVADHDSNHIHCYLCGEPFFKHLKSVDESMEKKTIPEAIENQDPQLALIDLLPVPPLLKR